MAYSTLERLYKDGKISFDEMAKIIREFAEEKLSEAIGKMIADKEDKQGNDCVEGGVSIDYKTLEEILEKEKKKKITEQMVVALYGCPMPDDMTWGSTDPLFKAITE